MCLHVGHSGALELAVTIHSTGRKYTASTSRFSAFDTVSGSRICDPVLSFKPRFLSRYRTLLTFSASRQLPPGVIDPVLGHEPIFCPCYRLLRG
jgi:hypothetical protein